MRLARRAASRVVARRVRGYERRRYDCATSRNATRCAQAWASRGCDKPAPDRLFRLLGQPSRARPKRCKPLGNFWFAICASSSGRLAPKPYRSRRRSPRLASIERGPFRFLLLASSSARPFDPAVLFGDLGAAFTTSGPSARFRRPLARRARQSANRVCPIEYRLRCALLFDDVGNRLNFY